MEKIKVVIKDHPTMGNKRAVEFEGVEYLSYSLSEAQLVWHERFLDKDGNLIDSNIIPVRRIVSNISNANKVTAQGIMISRENSIFVNPIMEGEPEENYSIRIDAIIAEQKLTEIPEFDFWMSRVGWGPLIIEAATLLEFFKRYDKP
jgi:hypothetical protein